MKKLLLITLVTFSFFSKLSAIEYAHFYMNCGGERTYLGQSSILPSNGPCLKLCASCTLEIAIFQVTTHNPDGRWVPIRWLDFFSPQGPTTIRFYNDNTQNYEEVSTTTSNVSYTDPITGQEIQRYSFDLSSLGGVTRIGNIKITTLDGTTQGFDFNDCVEITDPANMNDVQVENMQICKGDCLPLSQIVSNTNIGRIVSFGCGPNPIEPATGTGGPDHLNGMVECFHETGNFPLCFTVKNGGCKKDITGFVEVVECESLVNCQACCNYVQQQNIHISFGQSNAPFFNPDYYFLSTPIGSLSACGAGYFEVTFTDGTKTNINGEPIAGPFPKKVKKICYKLLGCPECAPGCLNVE